MVVRSLLVGLLLLLGAVPSLAAASYEGQTVVVVCHGGVIDAILRLALKAPGMGAFEIHTLNASITELLLVKRNTWRLLRYNDTAHLAGMAAHTNPPFADRA